MQTDYDIVDQTGLSFLADLNTTLGAIVSNNSGATQPATTFAYMWWADTTSGVLKQRNAANSAWVDVLTLAGIKGSDIANTPAGNVAATDVQAAIDELDSDISTNTSDISTNTSDISTNTSDISTNTSDISTNTSDILNRAKLSGGTSANFTAMPQVGGDPIVESGSNADGEWTRWADGTQQCTNVIRLFATTSHNTISFSSRTLPQVFISNSEFSGWSIEEANINEGSISSAGHIYRNGLIMSSNQNNFDIAGYTYKENISGDCYISVIAIGRWK